MKARTEAALSGATIGLMSGMGGALLGAVIAGEGSVWFLLGHMAVCTVAGGALAWGLAWVQGGEG